MYHRVIKRNPDAELGQVQFADRTKQRVGRHDPVMLSGHVRGARGDKRLLGGEHIERGALADTGLLAYAIEGNLGGCDLSICSENLRLGRFKLAPGGHDLRLNRIARGFEVDPLLTNGFLGLAYSRILRAALVGRFAAFLPSNHFQPLPQILGVTLA
jgi:hypothetical protein